MNRVMGVCEALGQVLNSPQSFGLGDRPPKPLVEALSAMRQCLCEELVEENQQGCEDWLSSELSQDADRHVPTKRAG